MIYGKFGAIVHMRMPLRSLIIAVSSHDHIDLLASLMSVILFKSYDKFIGIN